MNPILLRNSVLPLIREYFLKISVSEALTPLIVKSGGIEPYIDSVPLGNSLYLPTSPEISLKKQLSMISDSAKGVYEIAHAFRDEKESKNHLREFTMVEWYLKNTSYTELLEGVTNILSIISGINPETSTINIIDLHNPRIVSVADIFKLQYNCTLQPDWGFDEYHKLAQAASLVTSGKNLPSDKFSETAVIELFTLLYDHAINSRKDKFSGLVFIKDYPPFLRGMARISEEKWAMRIEALFNGLEICSGYQEEFDSNLLLEIWNANNKIRKMLNKPEHPVDYQLIEILPGMKDVSGMALGLERSIMAIHNISDINSFKIDPF